MSYDLKRPKQPVNGVSTGTGAGALLAGAGMAALFGGLAAAFSGGAKKPGLGRPGVKAKPCKCGR